MNFLSFPIFYTDYDDCVIYGNKTFLNLFSNSQEYIYEIKYLLPQFSSMYDFYKIPQENMEMLPYAVKSITPPHIYDYFTKIQMENIWIMIPKKINFYEKILENLHDCVFVCDEKGIVLYVNKTFEKYYGIERNDIIGCNGINFLKNNQCSASPIPVVINERRAVTMEQTTYINRTVVITAVPVFDKNNKIEMIVENSRDITEIQTLKNSLKEMSILAEQYKTAVVHLEHKERQVDLVANSKAMKKIMSTLKRVSIVDSTILLLGESGTGKTNIAKYIHSISPRKDGPFITINCSTIPESLFESELFGYLPGTFTGANKTGKIGLAEIADGGTLFLDEIGELPLSVQTKLLQLIQEQTFIPIGGTKEKKINIRIITATNQDLKKLVGEKRFREDLYYRLKVVEFFLPPLRERPEDLISLIFYFLNYYDKKYNFSHSFSEESLIILKKYKWPGNIRELSNIIENLVVVVEDAVILPMHLPPYMYSKNEYQYNFALSEISNLNEEIEKLEKAIIAKAYEELGSTYKVAKKLGISQSQASRKIKKYCAISHQSYE